MATITLPITCYVDKLLEIFAANEILEKTKHKFTIKFAKSSDFRGEVIVASNELISDIKLKYFNDKNRELTDDVIRTVCASFNHIIKNSFPLFAEVTKLTKSFLFIRLSRKMISEEILKGELTSSLSRQVSSPPTLLYPYFDVSQMVSMETGRLLMVTQLLSQFYEQQIYFSNKLLTNIPLFSSIVSFRKSFSLPATVSEEDFIKGLSSWAMESHSSSLKVNCELFLKDHKLYGKNKFPENIKTIVVVKDHKLTTVGQLSYNIYSLLKGLSMEHKLIILTTQKLIHTVYQSLVLPLILLYDGNGSILNQLHLLTVSPVNISQQMLDIEHYVQSRLTHTSLSCQAKYGAFDSGSQLDVISRTMSEAAVKFELLSTDPKNILKICSECYINSGTTLEGCFALYNYARMSTLVKNYKLEVDKGIYPPLPDDVDCSLLTDEDEWDLLYSYVFLYPQVIEETKQLIGCDDNIVITCGVKKLCQFLVKLCHTFSCYYSRVKILMSPEPALLPLVHVRLKLVITLKQVLSNGLHLLGITPLDQL